MSGDPTNEVSPADALQAFVLDDDLERLEDLLAEFNLFDVLKIERKEVQHSALLAWLLDPRGSHGLRDYFLRRFLSEAAVEARDRGIADVTPLDVAGWKLSNVRVETERHFSDVRHDYLDVQHNYLDILLTDTTDGFACLVENKIGSGEHSNQLSKYLRIVEREHKGLVPFPIYLTPDGRKPGRVEDAERYVPLGYGTVFDLVERTLRACDSHMERDVAFFLEHYARTLRRYVVSGSSDTYELALRIHNAHPKAIKFINDAVKTSAPAMEAKAWDVIDSVLDKYAPLLQPEFSGDGYHRFGAPHLSEIPELRDRVLLFEFKYLDGNLLLIIRPGPSATRKRLYEAFRPERVPGVAIRPSRRLDGEWHVIYSRSLFEKGDLPFPDYEAARPEIERSIARFFENDFWPIVNAVRGEFGLPPANESRTPNSMTDS